MAVCGGCSLTTGLCLQGPRVGDFVVIGLVIVISAFVRLMVWPALRPQIDLYDAAFEQGYDQGHHDGRRSNLTVIHMPAGRMSNTT